MRPLSPVFITAITSDRVTAAHAPPHPAGVPSAQPAVPHADVTSRVCTHTKAAESAALQQEMDPKKMKMPVEAQRFPLYF